MFARFDWNDRRAAVVGALVLVTVSLVYPLVADATARPLAGFVLPCLVTAVLGGWRPTLLVGITSLSVAIVVGLLGPLDIEALLARWLIIGVGVLIGAVGAAVRERPVGASRRSQRDDVAAGGVRARTGARAVTPDGYVAVARYRPAESRLNLGGDFLEAVALEDGRLAVLIGDVCGHGPREAAFGTALRAGWKAIALSGKHDPAEWVDALDASFFRDGRIDTYVTLCTGYLDVITGVSRLVNVGHPPPVLLEHPVRVLDLPPTPPLGLGLNDNWTAIEVPWAGQPMLLYTDGLVENPNRQGKPRRWGELGLLAWLDAHPQTTALTDLADRLVQSATTGRTIRDDIAILIIAGDR